MATRTTPPEPDNDQATRLLLIDASMAMFARHGFESTALAALAKSVGVTTGAVYGNFESKQDLFVSTVLHVRQVVEQTVLGRQPAAGTPRDRAVAYLGAIADLADTKPDLMAFRSIVPLELARNEGLRTALHDELEARLALCEGLMARRADGRRGPGTQKSRGWALTVLSLGEGMAGLLQTDPGVARLPIAGARTFMSDLLNGTLFSK
jgi:AcrR family transcriptional regulator